MYYTWGDVEQLAGHLDVFQHLSDHQTLHLLQAALLHLPLQLRREPPQALAVDHRTLLWLLAVGGLVVGVVVADARHQGISDFRSLQEPGGVLGQVHVETGEVDARQAALGHAGEAAGWLGVFHAGP